MIFQKSATTLSRSTLAAKTRTQNLWGSSSQQQSQSVPNFFVSTPQFTRHQQSQLALYQDNTRGAGNSGPHSESGSIGNPYLALTGGANLGPVAPAPQAPEDDRKDDRKDDAALSLHPPVRSLSLTSEGRREASAPEVLFSDPAAIGRDPIAEIIDNTAEVNVVDGVISKMRLLQAAGSHRLVLSTFETLETLKAAIPVEAYNIALESLASTTETGILLEAYERMLRRSVRPNTRTYTIVINSLVSTADEFARKRAELQSIIGSESDVLESVDEALESLAVEEYLTLAVGLLQAVVATHPECLTEGLQASLDAVVEACIEHKVSVPVGVLESASKSLVKLIEAQPTIEAAAEQFSSLDPQDQRSEKAQTAMLRAYFRLNEPRGAIAFFDGCSSPRYLLRPLIKGFASLGMVGTARRWVQQTKPEPSVIGEAMIAVPRSSAKDSLPSATQLFYEYSSSSSGVADGAAGGDSANGSSDPRGAFLRLCVAAEDTSALYMGLRESHLNDCALDPVTIVEVVKYLSATNQPMLAADLFAWQFPKLEASWKRLEITSFVGQEMASEAVNAFQKRDQFSLAVSLKMLPCLMHSPRARLAAFEIVAAARLGSPHEVAELVDSRTLSDLLIALASFITEGSGASEKELSLLSQLFPLLVEDSLAAKSAFTNAQSDRIAEALISVGQTGPLLSLWYRRYPTPIFGQPQATAKESAKIQRYALLPNGLDYAIDLLKDQIRLRKLVSPAAVDAVFQACARTKEIDLLHELYKLMPKSRPMLNSLIAATASQDRKLALAALSDLKEMGVFAESSAYSALIASSKDATECLSLFNEARSEASLPMSPQVYNDVVSIQARNLKRSQVVAMLNEMEAKGFPVVAPTWGNIISMHVRLNEGDRALQILKDMPVLTKSLLEAKVFNHLMQYYVHKVADRNGALQVFMELRATGTMATPYTYRLLIEAYLLRNQESQASLADADKVLALMRHDGAPITTMCFATLLRARGVLFKDFDGARNFYRGLVKNSRVLPDHNIFKALMESYVSNGRQSEASLVFDEMKRYHVHADQEIVELAGQAVHA